MELSNARLRDYVRPGALASALALALAGTCEGHVVDAPTPSAWKPGDGTGVAALFRAIEGRSLKARPAHTAATTLTVTSCADDNGAGTLRSVISGANEGDTIDLSTLTCGPITLTQGVIPVYLYTLTVQGSTADQTIIDGNAADRVFVQYGYDSLTLRNLTVRNGFNQVAGYKIAGGACILANSYVVLDHAAVKDCVSIGEGAYGGGILAPGIVMQSSTLSGNEARGSLLTTLTASYGGGAFAYRGPALLYDSTVSGNIAVPDPANFYGSYDTGAGIFSDNGGYMARSTVNGNYTDGTGGGIATHGAFSIYNSTISGNAATRKAGGGLFAKGPGKLTVVASTIASNSAARGGGIYRGGLEPFERQSTIVANNFVASGFADVVLQSPNPIVGANNLVMFSDTTILPGDTIHDDPQLLPLGFNGGPTQTHAIGPRSPAIDKGNNIAGLDTDQRGAPFPRTWGFGTDIGAFEFSRPDSIFKDTFGDPP